MHCHVLLYLICRMLKVFRFLLFHELYPEKECVIAFRQLEKRSNELGDAFGLLKNRIQDIKFVLFDYEINDF